MEAALAAVVAMISPPPEVNGGGGGGTSSPVEADDHNFGVVEARYGTFIIVVVAPYDDVIVPPMGHLFPSPFCSFFSSSSSFQRG